MNPRQIMRTIASLGGVARDTELLCLVDVDRQRDLLEQLRALEDDGMVSVEITITYELTDKGKADLAEPAEVAT